MLQGSDSTREIVPAGYTEVPVGEAYFVLVSGIGDEERPEDYAALLETALARGLPMICANPDLKVGHSDRMVSCAGLLVDAYERMVGDSLRTDIAGAQGAGLDTLFIHSGIHAGTDEALFEAEGLFPTYTLPRLRWVD